MTRCQPTTAHLLAHLHVEDPERVLAVPDQQLHDGVRAVVAEGELHQVLHRLEIYIYLSKYFHLRLLYSIQLIETMERIHIFLYIGN